MKKGILLVLVGAGCGLVDAGDPLVEAHRGAAGNWPQNSRAALVGSIDAGYPGLEFDLVLTLDGVPVISHDPWIHTELCTTTNGQELLARVYIKDLDLQNLQDNYMCGGVPDDEFPEAEVLAEPIWTFEGLLAYVAASSSDTLLHIDVKYEPGLTPGPDVMAEAVLDIWENAGLDNEHFFSANSAEMLAAINTLGDYQTSLIWPRFTEDIDGVSDTSVALKNEFKGALGLIEYVDLAEEAGADGLAIPYQLIDWRQVQVARDHGLEIGVWTPNSEDLLEEYCEWPVDLVITDFPERAPCL